MALFIFSLVAALYGLSMKLADLTNEHGLKWFRGDAWLFGIIWGSAGAYLMLLPQVANILLAQIIAYTLRRSLDYWNHRVAAIIMLATFVAHNVNGSSIFDIKIFGLFLVIFTIFGSLRDYVGNRRGIKDWWYHLNELGLYYYIPTFAYSAISGIWSVFIVFAMYRTSYNIVKLLHKDF